MPDNHPNRSGSISFYADPLKSRGLIDRHGVFARILKARSCTCRATGDSMYCDICGGMGEVYELQTRSKEVDEASKHCGNEVYPWYTPVVGVDYVDWVKAESCGGVERLNVIGFDDDKITVDNSDIESFRKLRVTYEYDKSIEATDTVTAEVGGRLIYTTSTLEQDDTVSGNYNQAHGDIVSVSSIIDSTGHVFENYTFVKNQVVLALNEPAFQGEVTITYKYLPVQKVLPQDLNAQLGDDKAINDISTGNVRMSLQPDIEIGHGDIITLLTPVRYKDEIIVHGTANDKLLEFDIKDLDDMIFDEDGVQYYKGLDYVLQGYREVRWVGNQPAPGKKYSIRYSYNYTYRVFMDDPVPNALENKRFPTTVNVALYQKVKHKDMEILRYGL